MFGLTRAPWGSGTHKTCSNISLFDQIYFLYSCMRIRLLKSLFCRTEETDLEKTSQDKRKVKCLTEVTDEGKPRLDGCSLFSNVLCVM